MDADKNMHKCRHLTEAFIFVIYDICLIKNHWLLD